MKAPHIRPDILDFHRSCHIIDLHVDIVIQQRLFRYDIRKFHKPWMRRQPFICHADIPRMLEGSYTAAALGLHYYPWESKRAWREIQRQLDYIEKIVASDNRVFVAKTAAEIREAKAAGKLALMPGIEGAHILAGRLDLIDEAVERGCLYLTLAHFSRNQAAVPGIGRGSGAPDGLSEFGRALVRKMNDTGLLIDLAHVNPQGVLDTCATTTAPVLATHSCAMGVHPSPRGLTDDGIRAIAETGGVIGVIFAPNFLKGRLNASLDAVVEHYLYIADLVGPEHLAFGSDFDGWIPTIPNDIRDCRDLALLTQKLRDAGMNESEVRGLYGENLLRVLTQVRG